MARIHWFITACLSIALGFASLVHSVQNFGVALSEGWPLYLPPPGESIALDAATRREQVDHRQPGIVSRFVAFIERALTHDDYAADHFDPGWRPA